MWKEYYQQLLKECALKLSTELPMIDYGELIYQTPIIKDTRWLVMAFKNEYNVFVEHIGCAGNFDRSLGATFRWKDTALDFALQMFLVCSGRLRRRNRHSFANFIKGAEAEYD